MTYTYTLDRIKKHPIVEYLGDPYAMSWFDEYKARSLRRETGVQKTVARRAVRRKCKYYVKIKPEYINDAIAQLSGLGYEHHNQNMVITGDGTIFVQTPELMTMLKVLYT